MYILNKATDNLFTSIAIGTVPNNCLVIYSPLHLIIALIVTINKTIAGTHPSNDLVNTLCLSKQIYLRWITMTENLIILTNMREIFKHIDIMYLLKYNEE